MKNLLLTIILFQTFVYGDTLSVDAQIQEIQSASPQERVKLMNEFKIRISQMNQEERSAVIKQMQTKMHAKVQVGTPAENIEHRQMQSSEELVKYQTINQHQVADQVFHNEQGISGGTQASGNRNMGKHNK